MDKGLNRAADRNVTITGDDIASLLSSEVRKSSRIMMLVCSYLAVKKTSRKLRVTSNN